MQIDKLTIIGVGLIGGSLARALKRAAACARVCGYDINPASLDKAMQLGVIDEAHTDLPAAAAGADVIVLAIPLAGYRQALHALSGVINEQTIITDVGSAKASVIAAAKAALGKQISHFVPGHPIAGRETSGVQASDARLFFEHKVIITPIAETSQKAKTCIAALWRQAGASVLELTVEHHDEVLAATSHLPHMLAYALVDCLSSMQDEREVFAYAAGGFADFSRIASSDPQMWHDVCLANRRPLLAALTAFERHLAHIKVAIENNDSQALLRLFTCAKQTRDHYAATGDLSGAA